MNESNAIGPVCVLVQGPALHHPNGAVTRSTRDVNETAVTVLRAGVPVGVTRAMRKVVYDGEESLLYEVDFAPGTDLSGLPRTREGYLRADRMTGALWVRGMYPTRIELDPR